MPAKHKTYSRPETTAYKRVSDSVLTGLTIIGGIVSILTLYPRMTITTSFEQSHPMQSSFLVSNDGYFETYSVAISCLVGNVDADPRDALNLSAEIPKPEEPLGTTVIPAYIPVTTLYPGEKELIPFSDCLSTEHADDLSSAHVGLRVTYKSLLWPWNRSTAQEFYVRRIAQGTFKTWVWYSVPYDK